MAACRWSSYETKAAKTKVRKGAKSAKSAVDFAGDDVQGAKPAPAVYESYQVR